MSTGPGIILLMRKKLVAMAVLCCAFLIRSASGVDSIPDVKTLSDLRRLPVVHTADGWDVQVGMTDPGTDAGPYRLLYCLGSHEMENVEDVSDLGPLRVELATPGTKEVRDVLKAAISSRTQPRLSCQAVAVGWIDDSVIRLYRGDKLLMERSLGKSDHRPCYWLGFASPGRPEDRSKLRIDPDPRPRCPKIDQFANLLYDGESRTRGATTRPLPPEDSTLPGGSVLTDEWMAFYSVDAKKINPLNLKFENNTIEISADGVTLDEPTQQLLARWWVNDRPIAVDPNIKPGLQSLAMKQMKKEPLAVPLDLPKFLGDLKIGDKIGLQLMYTEESQRLPGTHPSSVDQMTRMHRIQQYPIPLISNRLDIIVDDHLLSLRGSAGAK
jgi:hypothetical protein